MPTPIELLTKLSVDDFSNVVNAAPKKVREELFRRAGIKNRGGAFALRSAHKTEGRIRKLHDTFSAGVEIPPEICEEVIRHYLYHRRELLKDALDFLGVEHEDGLTEADLDFLEELAPEKSRALKNKLLGAHSASDVELYLGFMKIPDPQ